MRRCEKCGWLDSGEHDTCADCGSQDLAPAENENNTLTDLFCYQASLGIEAMLLLFEEDACLDLIGHYPFPPELSGALRTAFQSGAVESLLQADDSAAWERALAQLHDISSSEDTPQATGLCFSMIQNAYTAILKPKQQKINSSDTKQPETAADNNAVRKPEPVPIRKSDSDKAEYTVSHNDASTQTGLTPPAETNGRMRHRLRLTMLASRRAYTVPAKDLVYASPDTVDAILDSMKSTNPKSNGKGTDERQ